MKKQESKKSYAIFGLGEFGRSVAEELMDGGADVMAIDKDEDLVSDIAPHVTMAIQVDATELHAFDTLGLSNMDGVIVTITSCLEASIMAIMAAKEAGVPFILAKSRNATMTSILERIGADKIVTPERDGGIRVARNIINGNFIDFFELSKRVRMVEISVKDAWIGKSLKELSLRQKHKLNVVALRRDGELTTNMNPDQPFQQGDTVLVIMDKKYIGELVS
ncbi:MAG: TrkA family potassium uptake protein [Eubacterium sp.]|nr:TrkA family potassium uptake protein [Eubacterium sp.]